MRLSICRLGLCVAVLALFVGVTLADEEKVPLDKVPKAVMKGVKKKFPNAKVEKAEKETEDGKTVFEISITNKGQKIAVTVTPEGEITGLEKQIKAKDLPKTVTETLEAKYPKSEFKLVEEVIKVKDGKEMFEYFEVLLVTEDKNAVEVCVSREGKVVKEEKKGKAKEEKKDKN